MCIFKVHTSPPHRLVVGSEKRVDARPCASLITDAVLAGAVGGGDPAPGTSAALGNPAIGDPPTLFLFKAPGAPLPLS